MDKAKEALLDRGTIDQARCARDVAGAQRRRGEPGAGQDVLDGMSGPQVPRAGLGALSQTAEIDDAGNPGLPAGRNRAFGFFLC